MSARYNVLSLICLRAWPAGFVFPPFARQGVEATRK